MKKPIFVSILIALVLIVIVSGCIKEPTVKCGNGVYDPSETITSCPQDITNRPADLFDMNEMLDKSTLQLQISSNKIITMDSDKIREVKLKFYSTKWRGIDIWTQGIIYVPLSIPEQNRGKAAITQAESLGEAAINFREDFGARTAQMLQMPVMVCYCSVRSEQWGYSTEDELSLAYRILMREDDDLTREIAYPLAKIYMRTMTAVGSLEESGNPTEFVITGSSKRGLTQWVVAATDSRVKGFMSNAYNIGNTKNYFRLVSEDWGGKSDFGNSEEVLAWLETPTGQQYADYYDPYEFYDLIDVPFIMNVGTNDRLYPLESANEFFPFFSQPKAFELVDNFPHGMKSDKHLANWRAIIQRTFFGRKTPAVEMSAQENHATINITTTIRNTEQINSVKLYFANSENMDFRDSKWKNKELQFIDNKYRTTIDIQSRRYIAYYVELEDQKDGFPAFTSSMVKISAPIFVEETT